MYVCKKCGGFNDFAFTLDLQLDENKKLHGHFPFDLDDTKYKEVKCNNCGEKSDDIENIAYSKKTE